MQPRLLLLPIFSHGLTTATVSSWVHLILSSNLYRKFRTLLQDLFSCHPVTTAQHLSWKNCTGFPFQNVLSIKSAACLHSVSYTTLFFWNPHAGNPTIQTQDSRLSHLLLLWTPHLEFTPTRHCSTLSSFKAKLKTFLFSQYFHLN